MTVAISARSNNLVIEREIRRPKNQPGSGQGKKGLALQLKDRGAESHREVFQ